MNHRNRLELALSAEANPASLVGSYFHSFRGEGESRDVLWQGCIVAEPQPGLYLVELFDWLLGDSSNQQLVRVEEMFDWHFYDDSEWMRNAYEPWGRRAERRERSEA